MIRLDGNFYLYTRDQVQLEFLRQPWVKFHIKDHATCHCLDVYQMRKYCIAQSSLLNVAARTDKDNKTTKEDNN